MQCLVTLLFDKSLCEHARYLCLTLSIRFTVYLRVVDMPLQLLLCFTIEGRSL